MTAPIPPTGQRLSRRSFLKYSSVAAGVLAGAQPLVGTRRAEARGESAGPGRRYFFDFSEDDTGRHDLVLIAGGHRIPIEEATDHHRDLIRRRHPLLHGIPDERLTHHALLNLPDDAPALCYVQRHERGRTDGAWEGLHVFFHHPDSSLIKAARRATAGAGDGFPPLSGKWSAHARAVSAGDVVGDPVADAVWQTDHDHAVALIASHPEILALDADVAAYIATNIISPLAGTTALASYLKSAGATWATHRAIIDSDTNQPAIDSEGHAVYLWVWSTITRRLAGQAIDATLKRVKNDPTLGVNVSDPDASPAGKLWTFRDGQPAIDRSAGVGDRPLKVGDGGSLQYDITFSNFDSGYSAEVTGQGASGQTLDIRAVNHWPRHLGMFVRYLDGAGNVIPLDHLTDYYNDSFFPLKGENQDTENDAFLGLCDPQTVLFGVAISDGKEFTATVPLPRQAASVRLLASGLGVGEDFYPGTTTPGLVMTAIFELALPAFFLVSNAISGYGKVMTALQTTRTALDVLSFLIPLVADTVTTVEYGNADSFLNLAYGAAGTIFNKVVVQAADSALARVVVDAAGAGVAANTASTAVPVLGVLVNASVAANFAAGIVATATDVAKSPKTYVAIITLTHDIRVTIAHDPDDTSGFPATATSYTVTLVFDGSTPQIRKEHMPGTTVTDPIAVTFEKVTAGGSVVASVGFYSSTGYLVGKGTTGKVANTATAALLDLSITIEEQIVALYDGTRYEHRQVIALDANGRHVWQAGGAPATVTPNGLCQNVAGNICDWTSITLSNFGTGVGYSWMSYSPGISRYGGGPGQAGLFANLSTTGSPETGRLVPTSGFPTVPHLVYDFMGDPDRNFYVDTSTVSASGRTNLIRQIRLSGTPSFDAPGSNKAWGHLSFASDGLLLHPAGKIISFSADQHMLEVIDLPHAAVTDDQAPSSRVYSGFGDRPGLMNTPLHAAMDGQSTILVLESGNNWVQAFDVAGNPVKRFASGTAYAFALKDTPVAYVGMATENVGYVYVLSYTGAAGGYTFRLDIYTPDGTWLARSTGMTADKLVVGLWRDLYTLNYQALKLPNGSSPAVTEPSISQWIPSTPPA